MSKRKKKQLIMEIDELKRQLFAEKKEYRLACEEISKLKTRLVLAGSDVETVECPAGRIQIIHAETQAWGKYAAFSKVPEDINPYKKMLVQQIVEGLMDHNIVQFIVKNAGDYMDDSFISFPCEGTIGAKLFVVPWEQMRTGKKIELYREAEGDWHE